MSEKAIEAVADGDAREFLGADIGGAKERELSGVKIRVSQVNVVAEGESKRGVADELEALVRFARLGAEGGVGQCFF